MTHAFRFLDPEDFDSDIDEAAEQRGRMDAHRDYVDLLSYQGEWSEDIDPLTVDDVDLLDEDGEAQCDCGAALEPDCCPHCSPWIPASWVGVLVPSDTELAAQGNDWDVESLLAEDVAQARAGVR